MNKINSLLHKYKILIHLNQNILAKFNATVCVTHICQFGMLKTYFNFIIPALLWECHFDYECHCHCPLATLEHLSLVCPCESPYV